MSAGKLIFVYGTLKRGGSNHLYLAGQTFVGEARTAPGFILFELAGYPGMVADPTAREGVAGEVWAVDAHALEQLDALEGLAEGLYRRERVPLLAPFDGETVESYFYARDTKGRAKLGSVWTEKK
jgi:gamma-glutamylaminecyclotransferase